MKKLYAILAAALTLLFGSAAGAMNLTSPPTDDPDNPNTSGPNNGDPKVVPPIYGRWHAAVTSVHAFRTGAESTVRRISSASAPTVGDPDG